MLGGDGTMIGSMRNLHSLNVPFLGVNSGTVGFLTDISLKKVEKLKDILKGKSFIYYSFADNSNFKRKIFERNQTYF